MTKLIIAIVVLAAAIAVTESAFGDKIAKFKTANAKYISEPSIKSAYTNNRKRDSSYQQQHISDVVAAAAYDSEAHHHSDDYSSHKATTYSASVDARPAAEYEDSHHTVAVDYSHKPTEAAAAPAAVYEATHHSDDYTISHHKEPAASATYTAADEEHHHNKNQDYSNTQYGNSNSKNPYSFSYAVKDDYSNNDYGHEQTSDDKGHVTGSYRVLLPDGRTQIVTYVADNNGYRANVKYDGVAKPYEYIAKPAAAAVSYNAAAAPASTVEYDHHQQEADAAVYDATPVAASVADRKRSVRKPKHLKSIKQTSY